MAQHLHLTYSSERPFHPDKNTSYHSDGRLPPRQEPILSQWWKISPLSSRQEPILSQWWKTPTQTRTNPITVVEDFSTYIWPTRQKGPSIQTRTHPITVMEDSHPDKNQSYHSGGRFPALTSIQTRTHPITVMERLALTSDPTRTHLRSHIRMAPSPPRLSYMVTDHAPPLSRRVAIALTSVLLDRMASTHICHGRNLIL